MLRNRILAGYIAAFALGCFVTINIDGKLRIIGFALFGVLSVILYAAHRFLSKNTKSLSAISLVILIGMTYTAAFYLQNMSAVTEYDKTRDKVMVKITDIGSYGAGEYFDAKVTTSRVGIGKSTPLRVYIEAAPEDMNMFPKQGARIGDYMECEVTYLLTKNKSLHARGIFITASATPIRLIQGDGFLYNVRSYVQQKIAKLFSSYPDYVTGITKALIAGDKSALDSKTNSLFRNAGLSHILVISGLHISVLIMTLYSVLQSLTVRKQARGIICLVVLILYGVFVGFSPSVTRAVIMSGIMFSTLITLRKADGITSLFLALLIILLTNPYSILSVALGLSFLSTLGILVTSPHLNFSGIKNNVVRKTAGIVLTPLILTVSATIFSFPVILSSFDSVSFISPLTNLLLGPLLTWILIILIPFSLIFIITGYFGSFLAFLPANGIRLVVSILQWLQDRDIGSFSSYLPFIFLPLGVAFSIVISFMIFRRKTVLRLVPILILLFLISVAGVIIGFKTTDSNRTTLVYEETNLKDYVLIGGESKSLYIDLGGYSNGINTVYEQGYHFLDNYIMTGVSQRDYANLKAAIERININKIYIPKLQAADLGMAKQVLEFAKDQGCVIIEHTGKIDLPLGERRVYLDLTGRYYDHIPSFLYISISYDNRRVALFGGKVIPEEYYGYKDISLVSRSIGENVRRIISHHLIINTSPRSSYDYSELATNVYRTEGFTRVIIPKNKAEVFEFEP